MRTETTVITTTIYKFDELSDEAKEKFIEEQRDFEAESSAEEMRECMMRQIQALEKKVDELEKRLEDKEHA